MIEVLKGTVLHFHFHHLHFLNLDGLQSITEDLSSAKPFKNQQYHISVSKGAFPCCLSKSRGGGRSSRLNHKWFDGIEAPEEFSSALCPVSPLLFYLPAGMTVGADSWPFITPDWFCCALVRFVCSLPLRLKCAGSLSNCSRLTNFLCWSGFLWTPF